MIKSLLSSIPEDFKQKQIHMVRESSLKWFDEMPQIIKNVVLKWQLSCYELVKEPSFNNIVFYAKSPQYGNVVVKIGHPAYELFFYEPKALDHYKGQYACKLYDLDKDNLAMLLECLSPGKQLLSVENVEERVKIATNLLININQPLKVESEFPTYEDMMPDYFKRVKVKMIGNEEVINLILLAERLFKEIMKDNHIRVLTHGDYHHRNILQCEKGFKVIDPKGVEGFGFMDTAQLIHNELRVANEMLNIKYLDKIIKLVSYYSGYSIELLTKWLFIENVWRIAGNILYVKSGNKALADKVKRCKMYLEYYERIKGNI